MSQLVLRIDGLEFSYGSTPVLREASLSVPTGRVLAVVGGSGAGKSTLLKCLLMLLRPRAGMVEYFGDPSLALRFNGATPDVEHERSIRSRIGYTPQGSVLFPFASLIDNVALPLIEVEGLARADACARARRALDRLGVGDLANARPWQVSGGQAQRAAIARAMVIEPALYFFDEPTGALDATNVKVVGEALRQDVRSRECAAVVVTHNLGFAQAFCDEISVLHAGVLTTPTPVAEVDWQRLVRELI